VADGGATISVDEGYGYLYIPAVTGRKAAAYANRTYTKDIVAEFRLKIVQPLSGEFSAATDFVFANIGVDYNSTEHMWVGFKGANGEVYFRHFTAGFVYDTGYNIKPYADKDLDLRIRLRFYEELDYTDGIIQLWAKDPTVDTDYTLVYENIGVRTLKHDPAKQTMFSLWAQNNMLSGVVDAAFYYDDVFTYRLTPRLIDDGSGEEGERDLTENNASLIVPDSDIALYMKKIHPDVYFGIDVITDILKRIEEVKPIHVEIGLIGLLEYFEDGVGITDSFTTGEWLILTDCVGVDDIFTTDFLAVIIRWDVTGRKWDGSTTRWDTSF
jgi:hypothetical protein